MSLFVKLGILFRTVGTNRFILLNNNHPMIGLTNFKEWIQGHFE
jgi:hypothetical protein